MSNSKKGLIINFLNKYKSEIVNTSMSCATAHKKYQSEIETVSYVYFNREYRATFPEMKRKRKPRFTPEVQERLEPKFKELKRIKEKIGYFQEQLRTTESMLAKATTEDQIKLHADFRDRDRKAIINLQEELIEYYEDKHSTEVTLVQSQISKDKQQYQSTKQNFEEAAQILNEEDIEPKLEDIQEIEEELEPSESAQ